MAKNETSPQEAEHIDRLRWMLQQKVPIIGGWMHRKVASALTESAISGNWLAAQSLAFVAALHEDPAVREMAGKTLRKINYVTGIDAVWGVWVETRHPNLEEIAVGYHRAATHPASVRLLSLLRLSLDREDLLPTITRGSADLIPTLVQAWDDADERISAQAREVLLHLENPASIDAVCSAWLDSSRFPFLGDVLVQSGYVAEKPAAVRVLSALKVNRQEVLTHATADMVVPLIDACQHRDPQIASLARMCLGKLQNQTAIDEFCRLWSTSRSPLLEQVLIDANYKARSNVQTRILVSLKTGHLATAEKTAPKGLQTLLDAVTDVDETIRKNARMALGSLKDEETRDALCGRVIETSDPLAREIALSSGYTPRTPELRALYFFLTDQWQKYDALDFDQGMMRAIYEASAPQIRQRIAAQVQAAGRTDYLTILAGVDYRARAETVSASEAELMIRILAENREYGRLWSLVPELALPYSLEMIKILNDNNWRPEAEIDQPVFEMLSALARQPIQLSGPELTRLLPLAIQRATVKVHGRINDAAFSPILPELAIATSQRKVVQWNFQTATVEKVHENFKHSVGKVNYTPHNWLLCAERTNGSALCAVHVYGNEDDFQLNAHNGTVTVLETVGAGRLLTAGRDGRAFLWDLEGQKKVAGQEYPFWARSAVISPDNQYAALLHDRVSLARMPDLSIVPGNPFIAPRADGFNPGIAQYAAFSPDGKYILAGQHNGQVGMYYHASLTHRPRKAVVTTHNNPVRGVQFLPKHPILVTAGAEGQVRFISWPDLKVLGMVYAPEGQLTSLRISRRGAFMATGTNEASLALWDLRVLDIPDLFSQPLATATHDQVATVLALSEYHSLPQPVRNGLRFLRLLLQYRFRYDIEVEEAPIIQFGDYDILLDEV